MTVSLEFLRETLSSAVIYSLGVNGSNGMERCSTSRFKCSWSNLVFVERLSVQIMTSKVLCWSLQLGESFGVWQLVPKSSSLNKIFTCAENPESWTNWGISHFCLLTGLFKTVSGRRKQNTLWLLIFRWTHTAPNPKFLIRTFGLT